MLSIHLSLTPLHYFFFFFNDTATTEIYTLSLHDALPISAAHQILPQGQAIPSPRRCMRQSAFSACRWADRKSTRLNSSHSQISYAVFCLKKKKSLCINDRRANRGKGRNGTLNV